jgi:hypothetical protein
MAMNKKSKKFSEHRVNSLLTNKLKKNKCIVVNRVRLSPAEFDLIILDPHSLQLINIEIKRNNWPRLFQQAQRGKLYCHYSIAMVPISSKASIDIQSFSREGIGLIFYEEKRNDINLYFEVEPQRSTSINRYFKKMIYEEIESHYGDLIYA